MNSRALRILAEDRPGVLHGLTGVLTEARANITTVTTLGGDPGTQRMHLEYDVPGEPDRLLAALRAVEGVRELEVSLPLGEIYGKRIVVMGGGAQVGLVALGAVTEADRHNIRGERISVDTIPLVGEQELATAVRSVTRIPRLRLLVLAGSLMGGDITSAVHEVRESGILVISLNMAGTVPEAADLVVTDPLQAGVMAVMAIADTAEFDLLRHRRKY